MRKRMWVGAVCAGLLAGGAIVAQPPASSPAKVTPVTGTIITVPSERAADPPKSGTEALTAMLGDTRTAIGKYRDYSCTFTRQELRNGTLSGEEVAELKVRTSPLGVYARFATPVELSGMEVAYSANRKNLKLRYRPAGPPGSRGFQTIDTDDAKFMAANRHPVSEWTMAAIVDRVSVALAREKTLTNPVEVYTGDYQFAGRTVTRYEILTRRPHAFRAAYRMLVFVDKQTKLPLRFEAYDQPNPGGAVGDLIEAYSFSEVKLNVGLGENTFDY
jgi:hypothetical protein